MHKRHRAPLAGAAAFAFALGCGAPPRPSIPALTPQNAAELLHYDNRAANWLTFVRKQDPSCDYRLELPNQSAHPTEIDLNHIVSCAGRPSPAEFNAGVSFVYDQNRHEWVIRQFSS
ncbi:MAG: hypothetical protein ACRD4O_09760 [Bryobacteraceae bacterium]